MKPGKLLLFLLSLVILIAVIVFFVNHKQEQQTDQPSAINSGANDINEQTPDKVSPNNGKDGIVDQEDEDNNDPGTPVESTNPNENDINNPDEEPTGKPGDGLDPNELPTTEVEPVKPNTDAASVSVIVNPNYRLPDNYEPEDLVYPEVRFTFNEKIEKRMLREEAAKALESMFEAAEVDGIYLAGVSAYRSHSTQTALFNRYVERDGLEKAKTYSAEPGTSEHETGLAIDVSASDGKCAAQDCFGGTAEAIWLENNASEHGFIIRYPEGKQDITGYKYEPWHLRYVGIELAKHLFTEGLTLEEYYGVDPVKR